MQPGQEKRGTACEVGLGVKGGGGRDGVGLWEGGWG